MDTPGLIYWYEVRNTLYACFPVAEDVRHRTTDFYSCALMSFCFPWISRFQFVPVQEAILQKKYEEIILFPCPFVSLKQFLRQTPSNCTDSFVETALLSPTCLVGEEYSQIKVRLKCTQRTSVRLMSLFPMPMTVFIWSFLTCHFRISFSSAWI